MSQKSQRIANACGAIVVLALTALAVTAIAALIVLMWRAVL